jgi:phosphinothricin acetyltransferase
VFIGNMKNSVVVRPANEADLPHITDIYNAAVERSFAVFTEEKTDVENRRTWLRSREATGYPVLVAEVEGLVAGFASFADFRPWPGYRYTVEHSIYVADSHQRRGVGSALMVPLFEEARVRRKRVMIAGIESGNQASLRFHERLGFTAGGTLRAVGYKFGTWLDLTLLCKHLED